MKQPWTIDNLHVYDTCDSLEYGKYFSRTYWIKEENYDKN